jgi:hypothetical protein
MASAGLERRSAPSHPWVLSMRRFCAELAVGGDLFWNLAGELTNFWEFMSRELAKLSTQIGCVVHHGFCEWCGARSASLIAVSIPGSVSIVIIKLPGLPARAGLHRGRAHLLRKRRCLWQRFGLFGFRLPFLAIASLFTLCHGRSPRGSGVGAEACVNLYVYRQRVPLGRRKDVFSRCWPRGCQWRDGVNYAEAGKGGGGFGDRL